MYKKEGKQQIKAASQQFGKKKTKKQKNNTT